MRTALLLLALTATAQAQWDLQTSNTTASLRGIHALGNGIAWASGTEGTVLHTTDNGLHWQRCTTPPDADKLDFRGIQAFDANTAIVMSSGKGDLSRLYKTSDACQTWTLVFTNPDPDGFWDAVVSTGSPMIISILGDPVEGRFIFRWTDDGAKTWHIERSSPTTPGEGAFAASNSSLIVDEVDGPTEFVTGSSQGAHLFVECGNECRLPLAQFDQTDMAGFAKGDSAGVFSLAYKIADDHIGHHFVAVGGDYKKPEDSTGTAAYTVDDRTESHWLPATTPPHGYRSAVTYDAPTKTWITVGPNGTDISTDDGRNWRPLKPSPTDAPDADQHWNALSLPFVVGPHGRIGILNPTALKPR
jgi:photosystem II stability/assembly factor-like uncharacterized protein